MTIYKRYQRKSLDQPYIPYQYILIVNFLHYRIKQEPDDDPKPQEEELESEAIDSPSNTIVEPQITIKVEENQSPPPPSPKSVTSPEKSFTLDDGSKYCEKCDIKFNFLKTYLAHKQYYCKNSNPNADILSQFKAVAGAKNNTTSQTVVTRAAETPVL